MRSDMRQVRRGRTARRLVALGVLGLAAACTTADAAESDGRTSPEATPDAPALSAAMDSALAQVRAATMKYQDVDVAIADGYMRDPFDVCETADMMGRPASDGAMGIHFAHPGRLGITAPPNPRVDGSSTHTDFLQPGVLIYEPQADGSLELVAVENLVFLEAWKAAGNTEPPAFMGQPYNLMVDDPATELDEAHRFAPHYDLHVWLYRENPRGTFAQFNPDVSCASHKGAAHGH
ncbi:MAG TPA: hypothetical protein VFU06_02355 [Longimicrobiales bacterium]|nr:hypothetical protein [Longimicrobiales bacterium]